jgi:arylamine N-acetyltransferase
MEQLKTLMLNFISEYTFSNREYFNQTDKRIQFIPHQIIDKVKLRKYGLCMELNYLFHSILTSNGYKAYMIFCEKPRHHNMCDAPQFYDILHLAIIVELHGNKWFIDVGFGEIFMEPIWLVNDYYKNSCKNNMRIIQPYMVDTFVYDLYIGDKPKLTLRIIDKEVSIEEINVNYIKFFNSSASDFPLCRVLYERIYDKTTKQYIHPPTKAAL